MKCAHLTFRFNYEECFAARDIQKWEIAPLGPFLAKSFGTTISPWVVTLEALVPFITKTPPQFPEVLPYLRHSDDFNFDVKLQVELHGEDMREPVIISNSNLKVWLETGYVSFFMFMKQEFSVFVFPVYVLDHETATGSSHKQRM